MDASAAVIGEASSVLTSYAQMDSPLRRPPAAAEAITPMQLGVPPPTPVKTGEVGEATPGMDASPMCFSPSVVNYPSDLTSAASPPASGGTASDLFGPPSMVPGSISEAPSVSGSSPNVL